MVKHRAMLLSNTGQSCLQMQGNGECYCMAGVNQQLAARANVRRVHVCDKHELGVRTLQSGWVSAPILRFHPRCFALTCVPRAPALMAALPMIAGSGCLGWKYRRGLHGERLCFSLNNS